MSLVFDAVGWFGAILVLVAYILVSTSRIQATALNYQLLNIVGSLTLLSNSVFYGAWPGGFVNIVWAGIGIVMIARISRRSVANSQANNRQD
jgi:hypothetical protein